MKKPVIIEESEKLRILNLHIKNGYKSIISEQIFASDRLDSGANDNDPRIKDTLAQISREKPKVSVDSLLPAKKPTTYKEIQNFQKYVLNVVKDNTILGGYGADGKWGKSTSKAWDKYGKLYSKSLNSEKKPEIPNDKIMNDVNCISISTDTCSKIKSNKDTLIGRGSEKEGCSKWAVKCLSQYDANLARGDAWTLLRLINSSGGKEKYNMFTSSIDWNKVRELIKKLKINSKTCDIHNKEGVLGIDKSEGSVAKLINQVYPSSSDVNLSALELGDFVGMYWKHSDNKGKAFCNRAKGRGLDVNGNFKSNEPFTFNTHVGFVGAIKDGVPLIFHNVHGSWYSTPANELLNKDDKGMITWVASDPEVNQALVKKTKQKEQESWYSKLLSTTKDIFSFG